MNVGHSGLAMGCECNVATESVRRPDRPGPVGRLGSDVSDLYSMVMVYGRDGASFRRVPGELQRVREALLRTGLAVPKRISVVSYPQVWPRFTSRAGGRHGLC